MQERFETFTVLINRISRNIRKIKNHEMAEYGLRSAHVSCLYYLYTGSGLTATDLCERCEEDKATISRALDHLEKEGYLTCESKSAKRYKSPLILTEKGSFVGQKIASKIDGVLDTVSHGLTEAQRIEFYRCLSIISENLETISKNKGEITMKTRIIVDSTADLAQELKNRVHTVPMTVTFGEEEFIDGITIDHKTFYEKLIESDVLPKTSQATPDAFAKEFEKAKQAGEAAVVLTISSKLSGTYQSAMIAADDYENIYVVDAGSVAMGNGILAEYALRLADEGKDAAEIFAALEEAKKKIVVVALVDTLEYLKKGGRVSKTVAFAGGILNIKPVLSVVDGDINILGKARGSKMGNNLLVQEINKAGGIDFTMPVLLGYSGISDALLLKYIEDSRHIWEGNLPQVRYTTVGSVIGTHAGPGAVVVAFFKN